MTPRDPDLYTRYGLPSTAQEPNGSPLRAAIAAFRAWSHDPIFVPLPTVEQVRLLAEYCQDYIRAPVFTYPAQELAVLRAMVVQIRTVRQLADWLWECRRIGIEPLS
jgi:hypothetical protein